MNYTNNCESTLVRTNGNLGLLLINQLAKFAQKWMVVPLFFFLVQSWALPVSSDPLSLFTLTTNFTLATDSIPVRIAPTPLLTPKGADRTEADFQNYYLQVNCSRNYAAAMDEVRLFSKYFNTQLLISDEPLKYKVIIGPFENRAEARYVKRENEDIIKSDAFPRSSHEVDTVRRP